MGKTCLHCGQPITLDQHQGMWLHKYERWPNDNGYWCDDLGLTSANPNSKEKQKLHDEGWYIQEWFEGRWCHKNAKTGEHMSEEEFNKLLING
jgi:hypothetical protein